MLYINNAVIYQFIVYVNFFTVMLSRNINRDILGENYK